MLGEGRRLFVVVRIASYRPPSATSGGGDQAGVVFIRIV